MGFFAYVAICLMLVYYTNHFSNIDIYSFSTHYIFGWWGRSITWQCPKFNNIFHFFSMCQWEFDIIIIFFNTIATRVCLRNKYLIFKLLVIDSIGKLYDDKYLPQKHDFFLLPVYLISVMASSTPLTSSILSTLFILPIFSTLLTRSILCSSTLGTKKCNIVTFIYLGVSNLRRLL